ncbi:hypothetical protein N8T08_004601 [Aspergillus melleus]|uniref:Uncharacterized protein n=1 Tax=Aspergillus melleus TaxID=138277 RepID=A0ACC3B429_9EURO|nr:hypothetical protein N8T08_004601 [Aspergillus melleus]
MASTPDIAIVAQLILTEACKGHWIVAFRQSSTFSSANLEQNKLQWIENRSDNVLDNIKEPYGTTRTVYFWSVLWDYARRGYIEKASTTGVSIDRLLSQMTKAQSEGDNGKGG